MVGTEIIVTVSGKTATARDRETDSSSDSSDVDFDSLRLATIAMFQDWLARGKVEKRSDLEVLGRHLYAGLFTGAVKAFLEQRLAENAGRGDRLMLRLQFAARTTDLANLPWEYLYFPGGETQEGFFLGTKTDLVLSRYIPAQQMWDPQTDEGALRVGMIVAKPAGDEFVPFSAEGILEAVSGVDRVEVTHLDPPTVSRLLKWLPKARPHVLHFIGHGFYDSQERVGKIVLVDDAGAGFEVSDGELAEYFEEAHHAPHVVVLHLCQADTTPGVKEKSLVRLAPKLLIGSKVPAVVAMQHPFPEEAAVAFSKAFYSELARGESVDAAVQVGRRRITQVVPQAWDSRVFGTPVLFGRTFPAIVSAAVEAPTAEPKPSIRTRTEPAAEQPVAGVGGNGVEPSTLEASGVPAAPADLVPGKDREQPTPDATALIDAVVKAGQIAIRDARPPLEALEKARVYRVFQRLGKGLGEDRADLTGEDLANLIRYDWYDEERDERVKAILLAMMERAAQGAA